jgi:Protein of unknown function (DUF2514)
MVAIGAVYAGHLVDISKHEKVARAAGRAEVQQRWDAAEKVRAVVAEEAEAEARAEETRRTAAIKEVNDEAQRMVARARIDAAGAGTAAGSVRHAAAIVAGGGLRPGDPAAPASCPAAATLRDVLDDSIEALRTMAAEADVARDAGLSCERAYDSLTVSPPAASVLP